MTPDDFVFDNWRYGNSCWCYVRVRGTSLYAFGHGDTEFAAITRAGHGIANGLTMVMDGPWP